MIASVQNRTVESFKVAKNTGKAHSPFDPNPPGIYKLAIPDRLVYAILGRGYAAAVDYATLLTTEFGRRRLGDLDVCFIGKEDPWLSLCDHRMGQLAPLMGLPGFTRHPGGTDFLASSVFAGITQQHYTAFKNNSPRVQLLDDHISGFSVRPDGSFDLKTFGGSVHAAFVDVCVGIGNPQQIIPGVDYVGLQSTKKLLFSTTFLDKDNPPDIGDKDVCIVGSGPVGSVCCEWALDHGARSVLWIGIDHFEAAFPPNGRFKNLGTAVLDVIFPKRHNLLIRSRTRCTSASEVGGRVQLALSGVGPADGNFYDHSGRRVPLASESCDVLVIAAGFVNFVDELVGLQPVDWDPLHSTVLEIPIGLQAHGGKLRVLGPAAITHARLRELLAVSVGGVSLPGSESLLLLMRRYMESLPNDVTVPAGYPNVAVPVAARFIAEANGYFDEHQVRGPNWNCALAPHIEACVAAQGIKIVADDLDDLLTSRRNTLLSQPPAFASQCGNLTYSPRSEEEYVR
jgi:hypothetical protein